VQGKNEDYRLHQISHDTVVKEKSITIHYPHHPHYGKFLPVVEIHRNGKPPGSICRVSETVTLFIPEWVTYPESEEGSTIQKAPLISFIDLFKTAEYLKDIDIT